MQRTLLLEAASISRDQPMQRSRIAHDRGLEFQALAARHNGHAVIADRPAQQHTIARPRLVGRETNARPHNPDARGIDENAVALAAFDHLGVAGDNGDAGSFAASASESATRPRVSNGKPSSMMNAALR